VSNGDKSEKGERDVKRGVQKGVTRGARKAKAKRAENGGKKRR
jgi:hypothetical protein